VVQRPLQKAAGCGVERKQTNRRWHNLVPEGNAKVFLLVVAFLFFLWGENFSLALFTRIFLMPLYHHMCV